LYLVEIVGELYDSEGDEKEELKWWPEVAAFLNY